MAEELVIPLRVSVFHIFLLKVVKNGVYYGIQNAEQTFTMWLAVYVLLIAKMV
jgi:hypothetical protein